MTLHGTINATLELIVHLAELGALARADSRAR